MKVESELEELYIAAVSGTADSGTTTTLVDSELTEYDDDAFNNMVLSIIAGTNKGQSRQITDFVKSTGTIHTTVAFTQSIDNTSEYIIKHLVISTSAILCHIDFWSLAKQITITATAGDQGLVDVVVSGLPSNITIIAVQGMFICDSVQNSATGVANYLESTKIQIHKKVAGTDRDAIVLEANKVFRFTTDMIRGGTVFVADWATATSAGILAEVATNTTYEMWFDVAEALANNLVLDGAAFGVRIWFTI